MGNRQRIKGQTIQWAIDKGKKDKQYNGQSTNDKRTNNTMGNR